MSGRWRLVVSRLAKRLWFRAALFSLLGVATALLAVVFADFIPDSLSTRIGADAVDRILGILASSMLAVTTFSLSTMVAAYGAASSGVTPRATSLMMEDTTTQNALATFIGSFLFSLVGIIALSTGAYGSQGRVLLFTVTIIVVIMVIYTLLNWIDHLSKLGQVGATIDRVEHAAVDAINQRAHLPHLGGSPYPLDFVLPPSGRTILSDQTGYVQHIDVRALDAIAKQRGIRIYVDVLPGKFVHVGMPVLHTVPSSGDITDECAVTDGMLATLTIGISRTFEHDPRFGLCVLSEIASRALSPATNDSGTAIDVIGRGVRVLTQWARPQPSAFKLEQCELVYLHAVKIDDLFDDFFGPICRDGAGLIEIDIRVLKALIALSHISPTLFQQPCAKHVALLIQRADNALALQQEKDQLGSLAKALACRERKT